MGSKWSLKLLSANQQTDVVVVIKPTAMKHITDWGEVEKLRLDTKYVIILVHGTWGRKSDFLNSDSTFRRLIKEKIPDTDFSVFTWSGSNRSSSRIKAADNLINHIAKLRELYPKACLLIAAHSHGGNVALYAYNKLNDKSLISGIICFSTPFLNLSVRKESKLYSYKDALSTVFASPITLLFIYLSFRVFLYVIDLILLDVDTQLISATESVIRFLLVTFSISSFLLSLYLIYYGTPSMLRPLIDKWLKVANKHEKQLRYPTLNDSQLFIVRTLADEASNAIAFSSFLIWVISSINDIIFYPLDLFHDFVETHDGWWFDAFWIIHFLLPVLHFILSIIFILPLLTVLLLNKVTGLGYFSTSIFLDMSVESSPPGSHTIHLFKPNLEKSVLSHSSSYYNDSAIEATIHWIKLNH